MLLLLIAIFAVLLSSALSQNSFIPLSPTKYAFQYPFTDEGLANSLIQHVTVEYVIDLGCSSCLQAWPTLMKVASTYSAKGVTFLYRVFPLPYHQQAFLMSKGAGVVEYYSSAQSVFAYMNACFQNQVLLY